MLESLRLVVIEATPRGQKLKSHTERETIRALENALFTAVYLHKRETVTSDIIVSAAAYLYFITKSFPPHTFLIIGNINYKQ